MVRFVGLDVHKRIVEVCIIDEKGAVVFRGRCPVTKEDLEHLATQILKPQDRVALEATTNTWAVVRILKPHVAEVVVSNPLRTKAIAEAKVKTDKVDALVLAQLLRCDFLPSVWQPDERTQERRRLTNRRAGLVADRTVIKNRLHAVLAQRLILPPVDDLFCARGLAWLRGLPLDEEGRWMIDSNLRLLEGVEKEIAALDHILVKKGYEDARVKLLMTLPGVDVGVANTVIAALGDISRFADGDHAASFLGLVPSTKQSGNPKYYHGPITKAGNGHARWMLIQAGHAVRNHPGPLGVFFRRLAKKKNYNVAVVATARKLVVVAWHMLKNNEPYRYAQPHRTESKLLRLRVKATGERRKRGPKPGQPNVPKLGPGLKSRTIKPLAQIYEEEGLPAVRPLSPGEAKTIREAAVSRFVESLAKSHVVPVKV